MQRSDLVHAVQSTEANVEKLCATPLFVGGDVLRSASRLFPTRVLRHSFPWLKLFSGGALVFDMVVIRALGASGELGKLRGHEKSAATVKTGLFPSNQRYKKK